MQSETMPKESLSIELPVSCNAAFALIHDYDRRLLWDSMLSKAEILGGSTIAQKGVQTKCVATWRGAWLAMTTEYISFEEGSVAAVKLVEPLPFFGKFAATIRHEKIEENHSKVIYIYSFQARPKILRFFLNPLLNLLLKREIKTRLLALQKFFKQEGNQHSKHK